MFAAFHVAGTVLQVALILDTNNKDGIIESPANFISFAATQSGPEALSTLSYFESNWILAIRWPVFANS